MKRRGPTAALVIYSAAALHMIEAGIILATTIADSSIGLASLLAAGDRQVLALTMVGASLAAVCGAGRRNLIAIFALLPQQMLLFITAGGALYFAVLGHYADGYVPIGGGVFILADQLPRVLFCLVHSVAFYQWIYAPDPDLDGPGVAEKVIADAVYLAADRSDTEHLLIATDDLREIICQQIDGPVRGPGLTLKRLTIEQRQRGEAMSDDYETLDTAAARK